MSLASTWGHAGWPGVLPGQIAAMQLGSNFALKALPVVALPWWMRLLRWAFRLMMR